MKKNLLFVLLFSASIVKGQKIDSIYVNLYTDSLKKGTYNYINVDGRLSNGNYLPLDSSQIIFKASDGRFSGNSLWIDPGFTKEKVTIKVTCRQNPVLNHEFEMYIKKKPDNEQLKTVDELLNDMRQGKKSRKKRS